MAVLFRGDFDAGTLKPWVLQDKTTNADTSVCHFGTVKIDQAHISQGKYAARFDLPAVPTVKARAQLIIGRTINVGSDDWYTLAFYAPAGFNPAAQFWGVSIAEFNFQGTPAAPVALQAHTDHVTLAIASGVVTNGLPQWRSNADSPGSPTLPPLYALPKPMQLGVWHEFIVHCHWAVDATGVVEVWHRVRGTATWTKTVSFPGHPTLMTKPDGTYAASTLDVIQAYRGPSTAPLTLWLDSFTRSDTKADAFAQFPT